ncbi:hypothetical protein Tco_0482456, partial [Tanacetum coccineum]
AYVRILGDNKYNGLRKYELSHVGMLGEGLYGERFKLYGEEGLGYEDDKDDNQRIDWVDNHIVIREKRDGQM